MTQRYNTLFKTTNVVLRNFILYLLILLSYKANSKPKVYKEATLKVASLYYQESSDSTLIKEYQEIKFLFDNKKYNLALKSALVFVDKSKANGDVKLHYLTTFLIGEIFRETNNINKALAYYKESFLIQSKYLLNLNNDLEPSHLENFKDLDFAMNLLMIASSFHKLNEEDSASYYYHKVLDLNSFDAKILIIKGRAFTNLSGMYFNDSLYDKARYYANRAIDIQRKHGDDFLLSGSLSNLANIYLEEGEYDKAKEYYFEAIRLIENNKELKAIKYKELFYDNASWAMYKLKDYEAWTYLDKSFNIRDSLRDVEITDALAEIEAKHNVDVVKREEQLKLMKQQKKTWLVSLIGIFVLIILFATIVYYRFRQKNMSLKMSRNELIQQQKIEKIKSESQIRILNATIDGKESERKQIAETLHDSVSTLLSSANLHLQAFRTHFNGSAPVEIDKSQRIITEASDKIRHLSHTLVSSVLLKFGLQIL